MRLTIRYIIVVLVFWSVISPLHRIRVAMNTEETPSGLEAQALRERLSKLSEASVRISESLEFSIVLQDTIDEARRLTNARYGVIAAIDESGGLDALLTSGTTEEEHHGLIELPEGMRIFDHFSKLQGPLRVEDYPVYAESVGLNGQLPMTVFSGLAAPIRHHAEPVGIILLGHDRAETAFSEEDAETLVMFASQAALVIVNARRHRDVQRARGDLETLVNTAPVGVVVLEAKTGALVSVNQEAKRLVDILSPGQSPAELLTMLTLHRADGRESSLPEFPLVDVLRAGKTIRGEEITLTTPGNRALTTLINATPIRLENGEVEKYVITVQDMTPVRELERLRAEFLAMVSHELRAPLTSIKGSITTLLNPSSLLNPAEILQFHRIIDSQTDQMRELIADLLDVARIDTGTLSVAPEPTDLATLVGEAREAFQSGGGRHTLLIELDPELPLVMADRLRMVQVLNNLLFNAARHSQVTSPIRVLVERGEIQVTVTVADEGSGVPADQLPSLFRKFSGITTEERERDMARSGLGLAICKGIVEAHGGRIWAESDGPGTGARFSFTIPTVGTPEATSRPRHTQPTIHSERTTEQERLRVLAVDDDPEALRYIRSTLIQSGYEPIVTTDPQHALPLMRDERPHLALLDLRLPGTDGIELMAEISGMADIPVIFISAYGQDELIARAFEEGAEDYVVKPFSATELGARIKAALRRRAGSEPEEPYVKGDLVVDFSERRVSLSGELVSLTPMEHGTLVELAANAGRVVTHEQLLRRVWGLQAGDDVRPMRTAINSIRRKLGDEASNPTYIFTEARVGYRMAKPQPPVGRENGTDDMS
ncbi:MAG: response regulator [Chloroflexi bacterium]|nr:response regulator [Chloroflexota bacterium]